MRMRVRENINKTINFVPKNTLLYNVLFLSCLTIMYNNLHMQSVLKVKWINGQMRMLHTKYLNSRIFTSYLLPGNQNI